MNTTNVLPKQTRLVSQMDHNGTIYFREQYYQAEWCNDGLVRFKVKGYGRLMSKRQAKLSPLGIGGIHNKIVSRKLIMRLIDRIYSNDNH